MFNQLLQRSERGATGDEKSAFVQLSDAIMFDCISIPNCNIHTNTHMHNECNDTMLIYSVLVTLYFFLYISISLTLCFRGVFNFPEHMVPICATRFNIHNAAFTHTVHFMCMVMIMTKNSEKQHYLAGQCHDRILFSARYKLNF